MIHLGRMNYTPVVVFDAEVTKERSVSSFHRVQIFGHICYILVGRDGLDFSESLLGADESPPVLSATW